MISTSQLPFEIANRISQHLDTSSLANCCLVNKHWYANFVSNLWETPKVHNMNTLKSLQQSLENISNDNQENTNSSFIHSYDHLKMVRNLDLSSIVDNDNSSEVFDYGDVQTQNLLSKIAYQCSNLKSLVLKVSEERNSSKDAPAFFHVFQQFAKSATHLESLTLDFNDMTVYADHLEEFIPYECFAKINTLNLQNAAMVDDSSFIWFWSNCPSLTSVTISQSSSLNDYILNPLIRVQSCNLKSINLERCSRLSINSLLNIIVSCKNIEKLRWMNNGASFNSHLLSGQTSDFEPEDMAQFMNALEENCVIDHLKELNYAFLKLSKASVIFDYLIEKNSNTLEIVECYNSRAFTIASEKSMTFTNLREVSFNNQNVSLKDLSISCPRIEKCQLLSNCIITDNSVDKLSACFQQYEKNKRKENIKDDTDEPNDEKSKEMKILIKRDSLRSCSLSSNDITNDIIIIPEQLKYVNLQVI